MRRYIFWSFSLVLGVCALILALLLFVSEQTNPYIFSSVSEVSTTTAALVLGASVYQNGALSPVLAARANRAAELYTQGKVHKILVTGDNSEVSHNEVNPVGNYLMSLGIPKEDIFLDHAGFDTYSSMYRARDVFAISRMTIVSQPFHLGRAVYIARALGIDAYGVEAGEGEYFPYNSLREIPATVKALIDLFLKREPKFLGEQYPIEGNGQATWGVATTTSLDIHVR
ncbi:MAG: ElyC/SanA/YdcF family protein [Patescibacteria group bacterium]